MRHRQTAGTGSWRDCIARAEKLLKPICGLLSVFKRVLDGQADRVTSFSMAEHARDGLVDLRSLLDIQRLLFGTDLAILSVAGASTSFSLVPRQELQQEARVAELSRSGEPVVQEVRFAGVVVSHDEAWAMAVDLS